MQRNVETAYQQYERQKEFLATSKSTFWALKPHCESMLSDESRTFSNNMKMLDGPGGIASFDWTTLKKFNKKQDKSSGAARNFKRGAYFHIILCIFFRQN